MHKCMLDKRRGVTGSNLLRALPLKKRKGCNRRQIFYGRNLAASFGKNRKFVLKNNTC